MSDISYLIGETKEMEDSLIPKNPCRFVNKSFRVCTNEEILPFIEKLTRFVYLMLDRTNSNRFRLSVRKRFYEARRRSQELRNEFGFEYGICSVKDIETYADIPIKEWTYDHILEFNTKLYSRKSFEFRVEVERMITTNRDRMLINKAISDLNSMRDKELFDKKAVISAAILRLSGKLD